MLGKSVMSGRSSSSSNNRVFIYEVTGLKQNQENDSNDYSFRRSSSVFVSVPYNRMNEEMQRIGKMGGTIVNIQPLDASKQAEGSEANSPEETTASSQNESQESEGDND